MNATATTLTLTNDLLTGMEWGPAQVRELFHLAADIKARPDRYRGALEGKFLAMIFEKPSLRTRVTFEVGIASLGGASVFLDHTATRLGARESIRDVAKNLERMVHGIVARVFSQKSLDGLAEHGRIPVINALSDRFHPCQALCGLLYARGTLRRTARPEIRIRWRRQQCVPFAALDCGTGRGAHSRGYAGRVRARRSGCS